MKYLSEFSQQVYRVVSQIPSGKVMIYGQVAVIINKPKAARAVGNVLHHNPDPKAIPCHRVVNRKGRLAPNFAEIGWQEHRRRLEAEGVKFKDKNHVDLEKCQM